MSAPMRHLPALLAMLFLFAPPAIAQTIESSSGTPEQVLKLIEEGRLALQQDKYTEASKALEAALRNPALETMSTEVQNVAFLLAGLAASGREDYLGAHEYLVAATQYDEATPSEWMMRAQFASWIDAWGDAGLAITTVAKRWPAEIRTEDANSLVTGITFRLRRDKAQRAQFLELLNALYAAKFVLDFGIEPDSLWADLILDALARDDLKRAREIAMRVETNATVLRMRIDRRFDAVVQTDPKRFDLAAVARRNSKTRARAANANPRSLEAVVQYGYALLDEGRHAELLALSSGVLERVEKAPTKSPPFDDIDDELNWIYNHKAEALRGLGRWDESIGVMEAGRLKLEEGAVNVSQAINLGSHYNEAGHPQKALDALANVDWAHSLSPYGRMQLQHIRYSAYLQLGNQGEADNVFAWLREHHEDAQGTWLEVLLESGDVDGAAAVLIAQLRDADNRDTPLVNAQEYPPLPQLPRMRAAEERWQKLLARADVAAVLDEVGRREKLPIYSTFD